MDTAVVSIALSVIDLALIGMIFALLSMQRRINDIVADRLDSMNDQMDKLIEDSRG